MSDLDEIDAIVIDLRHHRRERRTAAAMRLLRIGVDAVKSVARSLDLVDDGRDAAAMAVITHLAEAAAVPLAEMLAWGTRDERRKAARALRELGRDAHPALGAVLEAMSEPDQDRGVVLRLFGVIRQLGPDVAHRTVPVLTELLAHETWSTWAADVLGMLGYHAIDAEHALLDLAAVGEAGQREAARRALARIAPGALSGLRTCQDHANDLDGRAGSSSCSGPRWERVRFPAGSLAFGLSDPGCGPCEVECVLSDRDGRVIAMGRLVAAETLQLGAVRGLGGEFRVVPHDVDRMVVNMLRQRLGLPRTGESSLSSISDLPIFEKPTRRGQRPVSRSR